jgi:hypothetical protein
MSLANRFSHVLELFEMQFFKTFFNLQKLDLLHLSVVYPDPGSGAFVTPGSGPGFGMGKNSGSGMNIQDNFSKSSETVIFWVKIT